MFEELNGLLFYPLEYEGEEASYNVFYGSSVPDNKAIPAVEYLMSPEGGAVQRFVLEGTDYVYPRTSNKIIRAFLKAKGVADEDIRETYTPFGQGTHVQVEPKGCAPIGGRIAWVKDKHAGVAFDAPIDVGAYLQPHHLHVKLHTPRSPRLTVLRRARLRVGPMWHVVQLLDLSQKGAKVESDLPIEMDESVELMVDGLPTVSGHVRWVQEARAGIEFSRAIPLPDLAEWARSLSGDAEAQSA